MPPPFEATFESLNQHEVPEWFHDAKFGIFVHWTMSCIPAYAPQSGSLPDLIRDHPDDMMKYTPYAEWYWNTIKFPDSPAAQYHREKYGDAPYEEFRKPYEAGLNAWDPRALVDLIEASGAQYVVLVTKHHDGFVLWPTAVANPHLHGWNSERDVVGDFAEAVRARGMRFGVYYSGGLDWTFNRDPIVNFSEMMASVPRTPEYRAYVDAHYRELIARYEPSVLWNDIAYPPGPELPRLFADYYGAIPDGVVNDRWAQPGSPRFPRPHHIDFRTPEYAQYDQIRERKWESTRGIGHSYGFAANEDPASIITPEALVHSFVDAVSKNGNLLLNIGPRPDGTVVPEHEVPLRAIGAWLARYGEAVRGTRPWLRAEGTAVDAAGSEFPVRFTKKGERVFAIVLGTPVEGPMRLTGLEDQTVGSTGLVGGLLGGKAVGFERQGEALVLDVPSLSASEAHAFDLRP
ncbi:MAG TPA: alpha-L-fucosidase [Tepidiformaceae bacterium]|nr:alpha-L-fucosidase [Tepidiformaceae bacterium]